MSGAVASHSDVTEPPTETVLGRVDVAALDREAAAAAYARCWEAAAKSQSPEMRAAAARYFAREAERKAKPPVQRRKERLSEEDVEALLASWRRPRPALCASTTSSSTGSRTGPPRSARRSGPPPPWPC